MHRSFLLAGLGACVLALGSTTAEAQNPLTTELAVSGLNVPVDLTYAPGDPTRMFIVERRGTIRVVENGTLLATPFLDIQSIVRSGGEQGLLGLAFHPDYQNNRRFFVNYTNNAGNTRVAEYLVTSADPNVADPTRIQFITQVGQDFGNHNGGCIKFGADGKLYVGMGDGGSGNDPNRRAQDPQQLLGKMLRYDVDIAPPFIPADNPFVGVSGTLDDIWQVGLRNPWRFTFDRATGDMWIADVGQGQREEIDFVPASSTGGENFGWRCLEGNRCTGLSGCSCSNTTLVGPIHEYNHGQGCSVTGGMIYRGAAIPSLDGTYFFADYCSNRIWSLKYDGTNVSDFTERTQELRPTTGNIRSITSFGEDFDGEVYILTQNGNVWKIIEEPPQCGFTNYCTANPTSLGFPAAIAASGSPSISANNFLIAAGGIPQGSMGIFFYGPTTQFAPSGSGNVCINGDATMPLIRMYPALAPDILGSVVRQVDFTDPQQSMGPGAILPGATVNFQFYFRDMAPNGMATWNFSDAVSVLFCP